MHSLICRLIDISNVRCIDDLEDLVRCVYPEPIFNFFKKNKDTYFDILNEKNCI